MVETQETRKIELAPTPLVEELTKIIDSVWSKEPVIPSENPLISLVKTYGWYTVYFAFNAALGRRQDKAMKDPDQSEEAFAIHSRVITQLRGWEAEASSMVKFSRNATNVI